MLQLAYWNFCLVESVSGKPNPYGKKLEDLEKCEDLKTKAAVRKVLAESYDNIVAALAGLDEAKLLEQVSFFNSKVGTP